MFDTSALTTWPTREQRQEIEAREAAGEFGLHVDLAYYEKFTYLLGDATRTFTWHQMALFALDNGLCFARKTPDPTYPGLIFTGPAQERFLANHVSAPDGSFDVGRQCCLGDQGNGSYWAYAAFRLERVMPQLILLNRRIDKGSGRLSIDPARGQEYDLGGVFAEQWRCFAPAATDSTPTSSSPPT